MRRIFPDEGSRFVYRLVGQTVLGMPGLAATFYVDEGGTTLADIKTRDGGPIPGSVIDIDEYSRLPVFLGPDDGTDTLYAAISDGPTSPVYARTDDRLDTLEAGGGGGGGGASSSYDDLNAAISNSLDNLKIGKDSGPNLTGVANTLLGNYAGYYATTVDEAVMIGIMTGPGPGATGKAGVSVGHNARATSDRGVAIGRDAMTQESASESVALGYAASTGADGAVAIGRFVQSNVRNQIVLGTDAYSVVIPGSLTVAGVPVTGGGGGGASAPVFAKIINRDAGLWIDRNGWREVTFANPSANSEDSDGFHDPNLNSNRLTVPAGLDGIYLISFEILWQGGSTGSVRYLRVMKNYSEIVFADPADPPKPDSSRRQEISVIERLAAGDFVQCDVFADGTDAQLQIYRTFSIVKVG